MRTRRLRLAKETLAALVPADLAGVVGGHSHVYTVCPACRNTSLDGCPTPPTVPVRECVGTA